ncbi:MAG: TonB-dependent receptor [Bacteroidales bacterium]|nr:TonB-dependent receptor [Bacteroidales bacterium]
MKKMLLILGSLMMFINTQAQITIGGQVTERHNGNPLPGAHIRVANTFYTAVSDAAGGYELTGLRKGTYSFICSFVGFKPLTITCRITADTTIHFTLEESAILGEEINIVATRAGENYPTAHATLTGIEIEEANLGRDLPYIIQSTPSVIVTSDAGNGIGYTGLNIRGTDLTRINVTINGIPLNDAESQGVWFVDLPDLASSSENIQIQRGVGTSTNGAGAFGATINILTTEMKQDPYGELAASYGSFNSYKATLKFGTGILKSGLAVDGRLSNISSDGYIDRAFSKLKSFYLSGGYYGKNTTLKLVTFSGHEKTYQAWEGVPRDSLSNNRTYNPAGEYTDSTGQICYYDNQTDNYQQDHYQLLFSQKLGARWNINAALFLTKGKGYYESYKPDESFAEYGLEDVIIGGDTITETNLVNQKWLDNSFYGLTFSTNYVIPDQLRLIVGGGITQYYGKHFGKVIWAQYASNGDNERNWYENTGLKNDINIFAKATWQVMKTLTLFADLQYRYVGYRMDGTLDDLRRLNQSHLFHFFNPKAGIFYDFSDQLNGYFSFSVGNREPSRNNYRDADTNRIPKSERLYDYELGASYKCSAWRTGINLYYMDYRDQLVLTGEINNVGEAIMGNVPHSYRTGIEITAGVILWKKIQWNITGTFSLNKIKNFTEYVDDYDSTWSFTGQTATFLGKTDLSFSPNVIVGSILTYKPVKGLTASLHSRYIGKQYIDNTANDDRSLHSYFVNNLVLGYHFKLKPFSEIGINLMINNLFSQRYETNAWIYRYNLDGRQYEVNGYFPQALINYMVGITLKL